MLDSQALPKLLGTDEADILVEFYGLFIEQVVRHYNLLELAIADGEYDLIAHCTHNLLSSSKIVGDYEIAAVLDSIGTAAYLRDLCSARYHYSRLQPVFGELIEQVKDLVFALDQKSPEAQVS
jgi:HPt (histidine-containing phosphotransfer) domain-containing protein